MEEENKDKLKAIYWGIALVPLVLMNLLPYVGIDLPETIDSDGTFYKLVLGFSLVFIVFLAGLFASFKCILYSEIPPTKVMASLCLLLYLIIIIAMSYLFFNAYIGA